MSLRFKLNLNTLRFLILSTDENLKDWSPENEVDITWKTKFLWTNIDINLLAPELFFLILAHPVHKMWIIQEPNKLESWNKLHFEEKNTESIYHV